MSTDQDAAVAVQAGQILAGKYRVERVLGAGGMGVVVAAHHIQLDEKVAIKFLLPQALSNSDAVARFLREARNAVKIKSEHVARVSDVGELENGAPYMVMEYLEGRDLADWVKEDGPLAVDQAVDFVLQACVAVADAHALGIVHRDLKPANLFCVRRSDGQPTIKVLDFGISKTLNDGSSAAGMDLTKSAALMGTPFYMSPEQMRSSRDVDNTTDVWALGIIIFELITGRTPFFAEGVTELVMKVANDPPPPLRKFRPDAPAALDDVIGKCLEKDPTKRYRNVGELAAELLPFAPTRSGSSVERISGILKVLRLAENTAAASVPRAEGGTPASGGTLPPVVGASSGARARGGSRRFVFVAGGVVVVAGAIAAVALLAGHRRGAHELPQSAASSPAAVASSAPAPAMSPSPTDEVLPPPEPANVPAPPSPSAEGSTTPPSLPAPQVARPRQVVRSAGARSPATPIAPSPSPKPPAADCDPPYVIDSQGDRQYKSECLRH